MPAAVKSGPGQSQEPGTLSFPTCITGTQVSGPSSIDCQGVHQQQAESEAEVEGPAL